LVYTQNAGWRNDIEGWVHGDVVRAALTPVLGRPLMAASTTRQLSLALPDGYNPRQVYAMLVLWQPTGQLPQVVNAERTKP
jgi:hypothetical protein